MTTSDLDNVTITEAVRKRYASIAREKRGGCCTPVAKNMPAIGYAPEDLAIAGEANLGLGCGNPLALAGIETGMTVLDLGSGAGFDAFLAWRRVGPTGRVIGVDMTDEMIAMAKENIAAAQLGNVEVRKGIIEELPVESGTVDWVISNCVINLSPDKGKVFHEAFRVLKPGGRVAVTDILATAPVPESLRKEVELYTACAAGAALVDEVTAMLREAGFEQIRVEPKPESREVIREFFPGRGLEKYFASATIEAVKPDVA